MSMLSASLPGEQVQALISFLEHEPQPMIVLDPDYNILASNLAYQRQFGTAGHSIIGKKCFRVSHHYDEPSGLAGEHCPMKKAQEKRGAARALHDTGNRARGPFVVVDCAGLTDTLFESELFGYEKGAFTGAVSRKQGLVETARGGTLFLDEIGDVPLGMQVKLLRLIESGTFRRVGGVETLRADFRLVAATHKPLEAMVADGRFRQDLYYRISAFPIHLPALRERLDDIPMLVDSFLERRSTDKGSISITPHAMSMLQSYSWPGNIRELRNVLERASLFTDDAVIRPDHLPPGVARLPPHPGTAPEQPLRMDAYKAVVSDALLTQTAIGFSGTRKELADHLGLSERTLYRRLKRLHLA